ncbi:MAG: hypothetical protein B6229_07675, partial [Spirochaetaceae bacterium 4572_7]
AILDDGLGMEPDTLQISLQFGNGTHLDHSNQKGIGKFGMGLPAASISQCKKAEVWSWKDGIETAYYTYIDIDEIIGGDLSSIPRPIKKEIPKNILKQSKTIGRSGTLILWSKIDRCHWKKGNTIINHSESLIGRIYRRFIQDGRVSIRMFTYDIEGEQKSCEYFARPNDPMYLMNNTSCPSPWEKNPMFERWGSEDSIHKINFRGETHAVKIKYSNMRADREITLDQNWAITNDTRERWWGVEVEFPPVLDEVFGLTNNKQSASFFEDLAKTNIEDLIKDGSYTTYLHELKDNEDPTALLFDIVGEVYNNIKLLRNEVQKVKKGTRDRTNDEGTSPSDKIATYITNKRKEEGFQGGSDEQENDDRDKRAKILEGSFVSDGIDPDDAKSMTQRLLDQNLKFSFDSRSMETSSFFTSKNVAGILRLSLNTDHPAYEHLIELLEKDIDGSESLEELTGRLRSSRDGLLLLLAAWARYEDEQFQNINRLDLLKDIRSDWGKVARGFFRGSL